MPELQWRTSSYTEEYNCVEVEITVEATHIRDSKDRAGGHFTVSARSWSSFLAAVKSGGYEV